MKLNYNQKYTAIAIYAVLVFTACLIIYKFVFTWEDSLQLFKNAIGLMAPFIISLFVAYFISPMLNFFEKKVISKVVIKGHHLKSAKLKRVISIVISYIIVLGTFVFLLAILLPQLYDSLVEISEILPIYFESVLDWAEHSTFAIGTNTYSIDLKLLNTYVLGSLPKTLDQLTSMFTRFAPEILNATKNIASGILNIILGFIIAIYLLFSKESYLANSRKILTALLPTPKTDRFFQTLTESHKIFSSFFVGKLIDSIIIGIMCFVILLIVQIPYALLISVIVGVTNMIPYFGPFIGGAIGIVFLLIATPVKALWFIVIIIALQQFDGNILGPKILGDSTGLTPFWVIFSIILFGGLFGILGMFIGVPLFAVIKNIFDNIIDRKYRNKMQEDSDL